MLMLERTMPGRNMLGAEESAWVASAADGAGWVAAKFTCEAGVRVTLIDGMVDSKPAVNQSQPKGVNHLRRSP